MNWGSRSLSHKGLSALRLATATRPGQWTKMPPPSDRPTWLPGPPVPPQEPRRARPRPPATREEKPPAERQAAGARGLARPPKEREVARARLRGLREPARAAALVSGIARHLDPLLEQHLLNERRAVVAGGGSSAPQVGRAEERGRARGR